MMYVHRNVGTSYNINSFISTLSRSELLLFRKAEKLTKKLTNAIRKQNFIHHKMQVSVFYSFS